MILQFTFEIKQVNPCITPKRTVSFFVARQPSFFLYPNQELYFTKEVNLYIVIKLNINKPFNK